MLREEAEKCAAQTENDAADNSTTIGGGLNTPKASPFRMDKRELHTGRLAVNTANQTGITPMLEKKTFEDGIEAAAKSKESADATAAPKRNAAKMGESNNGAKMGERKNGAKKRDGAESGGGGGAEKRPVSPDSSKTTGYNFFQSS